MKFTDGNRVVYFKLPVKIVCDGKDFWIKKSTKTNGVYMNDQPPTSEIIVQENENVSISYDTKNKS